MKNLEKSDKIATAMSSESSDDIIDKKSTSTTEKIEIIRDIVEQINCIDSKYIEEIEKLIYKYDYFSMTASEEITKLPIKERINLLRKIKELKGDLQFINSSNKTLSQYISKEMMEKSIRVIVALMIVGASTTIATEALFPIIFPEKIESSGFKTETTVNSENEIKNTSVILYGLEQELNSIYYIRTVDFNTQLERSFFVKEYPINDYAEYDKEKNVFITYGEKYINENYREKLKTDIYTDMKIYIDAFDDTMVSIKYTNKIGQNEFYMFPIHESISLYDCLEKFNINDKNIDEYDLMVILKQMDRSHYDEKTKIL